MLEPDERYRIAWRSRIPYDARVRVHRREMDEPRVDERRGHAASSPGTGHWRLFEQDGVTAVTYEWNVAHHEGVDEPARAGRAAGVRLQPRHRDALGRRGTRAAARLQFVSSRLSRESLECAPCGGHWRLMLIGGVTLSGCSFTGDDAQGASHAKPKRAQRRPGRVRRVRRRHPARSERQDRCGPLPSLRRARARRHLVPERADALRLDHEGGAADPRRDRAAAGDRADGARPSALDLHRARQAPATGSCRPRRPPRCARCATARPSRAQAPAIIPNLKGGRGGALRALHPLDPRDAAGRRSG